MSVSQTTQLWISNHIFDLLVNHRAEGGRTIVIQPPGLGMYSCIPQHPSLRAYSHQLSLLQAQLSQWQQKAKFARNQIRNLISSLQSTDPPHIVYTAHLALITHLTTPAPVPTTLPSPGPSTSKPPPLTRTNSSSNQPSLQDVFAALDAVGTLEARATTERHNHVALLARVLCARILVAAGLWSDVRAALARAEEALGLSYEPAATPRARRPLQPTQTQAQTQTQSQSQTQTQGSASTASAAPPAEQTFIMFEDPCEAAMAVHLLMISVVYYTHVGDAAEVSPRLSHLHALLDSEVLEKFPEGHLEVSTIKFSLFSVSRANGIRFVGLLARGTVTVCPGHPPADPVPTGIPYQQRFEEGRCRPKAQTQSLRSRRSGHLGDRSC